MQLPDPPDHLTLFKTMFREVADTARIITLTTQAARGIAEWQLKTAQNNAQTQGDIELAEIYEEARGNLREVTAPWAVIRHVGQVGKIKRNLEQDRLEASRVLEKYR